MHVLVESELAGVAAAVAAVVTVVWMRFPTAEEEKDRVLDCDDDDDGDGDDDDGVNDACCC